MGGDVFAERKLRLHHLPARLCLLARPPSPEPAVAATQEFGRPHMGVYNHFTFQKKFTKMVGSWARWREFNNRELKKLCDENKLELIFALSHAPTEERANRTIKAMSYRYLESTNNKTVKNFPCLFPQLSWT